MIAAEAPGWQGATKAHTACISTEERRSQPGVPRRDPPNDVPPTIGLTDDSPIYLIRASGSWAAGGDGLDLWRLEGEAAGGFNFAGGELDTERVEAEVIGDCERCTVPAEGIDDEGGLGFFAEEAAG